MALLLVTLSLLLLPLSAIGQPKMTDNPQVRIEAIEYSSKTIYHSPETPGYTSWVGLWRMPDGRLKCSFTQLTKSGDKIVAGAPVLESRDSGESWTVVWNGVGAAPPDGVRTVPSTRLAALRDGTMIRPTWAAASDSGPTATGWVQRSADGGKTWGKKIYFLPPDKYRTWPTVIKQLRDGRVVLVAGCWKRGDGDKPLPRMTKMMFISSDKGRTWGKPIIIMPTDVGVCEESDFCELPNGDLFWVHRVEHYLDKMTEIPPLAARMGPEPPALFGYSDRMQSITRKKGKTFVPGPSTPAPFRHSGFPCVLYTKEGIILHLATDGIYASADVGKSWTRLDIPGTSYYPMALQLPDGWIVCVAHVGGDDVYGTVDQSVVQQTFRLKVSGGKK